MLNDLLTVGGSVLTLLILMAVGFFLAKRKLLSDHTLTQISTVLMYVVSPALIISTFLDETRDGPTVRNMLVTAAVLAGTYVLQAVAVLLCFRRQSDETRGVSRFAAIYGNVGFMGVPLIQSVLGASGMIVTVISLGIFNIAIWTHGICLVGGKGRISPRKVLLNPGVIGMVIALAIFASGLRLPLPVRSAVGYISSLNTPLAMVVIGAQMAAVNLPKLLRETRLLSVAAVKLLILPAVTMVVLLPFGLDPVIYTAVVILSGCPSAGASSLMCQMAGKDAGYAARLVTFTTILSVVTLPVVSALAKLLAGF